MLGSFMLFGETCIQVSQATGKPSTTTLGSLVNPRAGQLAQRQLPRLSLLVDGVVSGTEDIKRVFPRFLRGGVIMDVVNDKQAQIAEAVRPFVILLCA